MYNKNWRLISLSLVAFKDFHTYFLELTSSSKTLSAESIMINFLLLHALAALGFVSQCPVMVTVLTV